MEVLSFFWSVSIILTISIFSILLGFGLKSLGISKKVSALTIFSCFLVILILIGILNPSLINIYNSSILMIIGFINLTLGMVMIREAKHDKLNTKKMSILSFIFIPLFIILIVIIISFFSVQLNLDTFSIGLTILTNLVIFTLISYFLLNKIISLKKPFSFFSNLNFFLGSVAIILCLIIPNVVESFDNQMMGGIGINSPMLLGFFLGGFIILLVIGLFVTKRKNILIK